MRNLDVNQMENLEAGNCVTSAIALGLSVVAVGVLGATTMGAGFFAAGFILGSVNLAHACQDTLERNSIGPADSVGPTTGL